MFVVVGATGRTGSVVARTLLEQGKPVRVIVRDEKKGVAWRQRGAEVVRASVAQPGALVEALRGAEGAYLMVPPDMTSNSVIADEKRVVDAYADVIEAARPKKVVLLSSIGAQHRVGTGPIAALHYAEQRLGRSPTKLTSLRAAYFMENWTDVLPLAREQGILPSMMRPGARVPMVATADIGRVAAETLLDGSAGIIELAGPEDYTPEEVAETVSKILGKPIQRIDVPDEGIVSALLQAGFTRDLAALFREMYQALAPGGLAVWTREPQRGRIRLEEVLRAPLTR